MAAKIISERTIEISAHIYFYGGMATEETAKKLTDKISEKWNEVKKIKLNGKEYTVKFTITYEVLKDRNAALKIASQNGDNALNNFVRLEKDLGRGIGQSFMRENRGAWQSIDYDLPDGSVDYTSAHEFMHGMGVYVHSYWDSESGEIPDIGVGGEYVPAGMVINPVVKEKNINAVLNANKVKAKESGKEVIQLGKVTNQVP